MRKNLYLYNMSSLIRGRRTAYRKSGVHRNDALPFPMFKPLPLARGGRVSRMCFQTKNGDGTERVRYRLNSDKASRLFHRDALARVLHDFAPQANAMHVGAWTQGAAWLLHRSGACKRSVRFCKARA